MRCLVTGASGHFGSCLVRHLLLQGAEVQVVVRRESNLWRLQDVLGRVRIVYADLADIGAAAPHLREAPPDVAFHLAWHGVTAESRNTTQQITLNVTGALRLLEVLHSMGCRYWVGVGSQAEYGPYPVALTEDLPVRPVTAYGVSKLAVGLLTRKMCELAGMKYLWFRLLATYGPEDDPRHLIPSVILQFLAGQRPALTAGEQICDYLYVEDAAEALCQAVVAGAEGVFVLGSGEGYTVRSIVEQIRQLIDPARPVGFGDLPYRPDQVMHLLADISSLRAATGWRPRTSLREGLCATVQWHRSRSANDFYALNQQRAGASAGLR